MPFGQSAGPPASSKQVTQLLALLQDAGYDGFRDARGPLRLTQRQAGGKFTREEADALIEQLETEAESAPGVADAPGGTPAATPRAAKAPATPRLTAAERALRDMPDATPRGRAATARLDRRRALTTAHDTVSVELAEHVDHLHAEPAQLVAMDP